MAEKKKITGGDVLIKCLLQEDIKYLFGIPGGQFLKMYDAIYQWGREKGIDTVLFRHEQAAAHAADAWARVTNQPGICFGTAGPGAVDLVPGINAAWGDNIPVIALVPQVISKYQDSFTLQSGLDQVGLFKPITKYQKSVRKIEEIPDAVQKCFREATGGRPRPVLLEIYEDAFIGEIDEEELSILEAKQYRPIHKPAINQELIDEAFEMIVNAEKPLIVSGGGVSRAEAWDELKEFAEHLQIPVMTSLMGVGTMPNTSKCLIGASIAGTGLKAAAEADVVLGLGCRFSYCMGHGDEPFWKDTQKFIQVDIDPTIIGRQKPLTMGIVGDCKQFLNQILSKAKGVAKVDKRDWLEELANLRQATIQKVSRKASKDKVPILPNRLVKDLFEWIDDDAILILDGGDISAYAAEQIDFHKNRSPLSMLQPVGMGQLGVAVPYGIGAKLAKPEKQVVALAGDGSFMINVQDLETAVRLDLKNLIYVVANNNAWGMIKSGQKLFCGKRYIDVDFPEFDYGKCAEGFGCYGEIVTESDEIKPALDRAKNSGKPAVLDIKIKFDTPDATKLMGSMGIL
ncbi:MAG: thiamine pyrophosphate-binding protein [Candidatus Lokiarchaeota archaeon]|nr:thiamine pyrophosphate-binding protein [Candidatus Lokiarchaeota archaeon]MBD3339049.1 thiamine pyrophosphate-binding protein [Candidatus Lokiarchaeota archaeon]